MKSFLILFIMSLFLTNVETNTYNLKIKSLLTPNVCCYGMFILDAELNIPIKDSLKSDKFFPVALRNSNSHQGGTACFLVHFPGVTSAKVGCIIPGFEQAVYQILPFTQTGSYTLYGHTINVLPYTIKDPISMVAGIEMYYFSPTYEIKMNFKSLNEQGTLEFLLFTDVSGEKVIIAIDEILLACNVKNGNQLKCPVVAKGFVQERKHLYQPYILDTNKKVKKNYFINPIEITLEYLN